MIAKKIGLHEWNFIGIQNFGAKWLRPFCNYYLIKKDEDSFERIQEIKLPFYILIFIPIHLCEILYLMYDSGLREFYVIDKILGHNYIYNNEYSKDVFQRALKIFNKNA